MSIRNESEQIETTFVKSLAENLEVELVDTGFISSSTWAGFENFGYEPIEDAIAELRSNPIPRNVNSVARDTINRRRQFDRWIVQLCDHFKLPLTSDPIEFQTQFRNHYYVRGCPTGRAAFCLEAAAQIGHVDMVKSIVTTYVPTIPPAKTSRWFSGLYQPPKYLISPNASDLDIITAAENALLQGIKNNHLDVTKILYPLFTSNPSDRQSLHREAERLAIETGNLEMVKFVCGDPRAPKNRYALQGYIETSGSQPNPEVAKFFIDAIGDNIYWEVLKPAITAATEDEFGDTFDYLFEVSQERNYPINILDIRRWIRYMIAGGDVARLQRLEAYFDPPVPLSDSDDVYVSFAAKDGHLAMIRYLISKVKLSNTYPIIPFAAAAGDLEIIQMLVSDIQIHWNEHSNSQRNLYIDWMTSGFKRALIGGQFEMALFLGPYIPNAIAAINDALPEIHAERVNWIISILTQAGEVPSELIVGLAAFHPNIFNSIWNQTQDHQTYIPFLKAELYRVDPSVIPILLPFVDMATHINTIEIILEDGIMTNSKVVAITALTKDSSIISWTVEDLLMKNRVELIPILALATGASSEMMIDLYAWAASIGSKIMLDRLEGNEIIDPRSQDLSSDQLNLNPIDSQIRHLGMITANINGYPDLIPTN